MDKQQQVEHVARAFYETQDTAPGWENEPEVIKDEFRVYARIAISLVENRESEPLARELEAA